MPLKLVPPRKGKTPNWYVRGTYLRVYVDESTGSPERRVARQKLDQIRRQIERGEFGEPAGPTFAEAALNYMQAGGESRSYTMGKLLRHFKEQPLAKIDQAAIDAAAQELYPNASPATRNRQVYSIVSAVLKHAGIQNPIRRPKGALGNARTNWLWPEQAFRLFKVADKIDAEFGVFLRFLTYTGLRLSEALNLEWSDVRLDEAFAYVPDTKTGTPRPVYLPPMVQAGLGTLEAGHGRVYRFTKSGRLYHLLREAKKRAGLPSANFHTLRHTYATWMRRYAGLDTRALIATGAWKDPEAARRYEHVIASEEAMKAALLPTEETDGTE